MEPNQSTRTTAEKPIYIIDSDTNVSRRPEKLIVEASNRSLHSTHNRCVYDNVDQVVITLVTIKCSVGVREL